MGLQDNALEYASNDIAVFPCLPSKAPATTNGFKDATCDPAKVSAWFRTEEHLLIGAEVPNGVLVVDIDPRNGGDETLAKLRADGIRFPRTRTARTGSGGTHLWYTIPLDYPNIRSTAGEGIDLKRHGKGYVIMPPSISDVGKYYWTQQGDATELPAETLQHLTRKAPKRATDFTPTVRAPWLPSTPYADVALRNEIEELKQARDGGRNNALNKAAFALYQLVHGGEIEEDLVTYTLCDAGEVIGLEESEIDLTLKSAMEAAVGSARSAPTETPTRPMKGAQIAPQDHERAFWTDWQVNEPDRPPYYLDPVLPKNAYVLVYGATEAAKSMTWTALLAQGSHHGIKSSVYSLENPPHVDRSRLRRLGPDADNFRITHQPLDVNDFAQVEELVKRERSWGTDVVLIDTYSHAFSSRSDDGNAKAIEFARVVRHVMEQVGCSVVVIDHTGYMQREEPRDASAKRQQVDVAILMEKDGAWTRGQPARFRMTNFKSARFGNPFEDIRGSIHDTSDDGLELQWFNADFASKWMQ